MKEEQNTKVYNCCRTMDTLPVYIDRNLHLAERDTRNFIIAEKVVNAPNKEQVKEHYIRE